MSTTTSRTSEHSPSASRANAHKDVKSHESPQRDSSTSRSAGDLGNDWTVWNFLADIGRQQFAVAMECTSAMYRGSESLRKIQHDIAHEASVRHGKAAEKLYGQSDPSDLVPLQSQLLRDDLQSAGQYWQQLTLATMQTQRELMASMSHMLENETGKTRRNTIPEKNRCAPNDRPEV
jgi:hypothetical protein